MVRIGELSRRTGLSVHVLRAWERRYGLLRPERSPGGYRLYSETDELRVKVMRAHLARGLSTAEAARATLLRMPVAPPGTGPSEPGGAVPAAGAGPSAGAGETAPSGGTGGRPGSGGAPPEPAGARIDAAPVRGRRSHLRPAATGPAAGDRLAEGVTALAGALRRLDEPAGQMIIDRLLATFTAETVVRAVLLPCLRELGEWWRRGELSVAQEHFASNVLRARLMHLARGWGRGGGPRALLACAPGERHDIGLVAFGVALYRAGWRIAFLGADVPVDAVLEAAAVSSPDLVVLSAVTPERFAGLEPGLRRLARIAPVALGGHGATPGFAHAAGARLLPGDAVTEAELLAAAGGAPGSAGG